MGVLLSQPRLHSLLRPKKLRVLANEGSTYVFAFLAGVICRCHPSLQKPGPAPKAKPSLYSVQHSSSQLTFSVWFMKGQDMQLWSFHPQVRPQQPNRFASTCFTTFSAQPTKAGTPRWKAPCVGMASLSLLAAFTRSSHSSLQTCCRCHMAALLGKPLHFCKVF